MSVTMVMVIKVVVNPACVTMKRLDNPRWEQGVRQSREAIYGYYASKEKQTDIKSRDRMCRAGANQI